MNARKTILLILTALAVIPAMGQGRQVLTDGIVGQDRVERYMFIQAISPLGDSCTVLTDSIGRFEIEPGLMDIMPGNVYIKPVATRPKAKLTIVNPFDSIKVYRKGRDRYLSQNQIFDTEKEEEVFYFDPDVIVLTEATVKARGNIVARDKVTGYLDSLAILASTEWVCDHGTEKYLNDWHGYSHHSHPRWPANEVEHFKPKRGETYRVIKYIPLPDDPQGRWIVDMSDFPHDVIYPGPQYTEEELLEIYGMWKAQGYYPKREFYEPDDVDLASSAPDYRTLLQWQPAVITDENGVAEIPLAASDVNTEFIGIIEAIDGSGLLGAQTFTFRIIKY